MDTNLFDLVKELQQIRIDLQNSQLKIEDTIRDSLTKVDELQHMLPEEFDMATAVALCKAGYFVKHIEFSGKESMHYYDGVLYYEDGTTVTVQYLQEQNLNEHWSVKKNPLEIDLVKLRDMHQEGLTVGTYEACFK